MDNLEKNFVSAVVYLKDSEALLDAFITQLDGYLRKKFAHFEIILVNDCSADKSAQKVHEIGRTLSGTTITLLNMSFYQGLEVSMVAGVDLSIGDFVFEFDSVCFDFSENDLDEVYAKCISGYDIVSASSDRRMRISSKLFYSIFNRSRKAQTISTEQFRILSRRAINRIKMVSDSVVYRKAVYYSCGLKTSSHIYCSNKTCNHTPAWSIYDFKLAIDSILYFTNLGFVASFTLSLIMMLFSAFGLLYTLSVYMFLKQPVEGWMTTMLFLSFGFFGMFSLIAVLVKYASLILETTHKKQSYIFESIQRVNQN